MATHHARHAAMRSGLCVLLASLVLACSGGGGGQDGDGGGTFVPRAIEVAESPRVGFDLALLRAHGQLYVGREDGAIASIFPGYAAGALVFRESQGQVIGYGGS